MRQTSWFLISVGQVSLLLEANSRGHLENLRVLHIQGYPLELYQLQTLVDCHFGVKEKINVFLNNRK